MTHQNVHSPETKTEASLRAALLKYEQDEVRFRLTEVHLTRQLNDREKRIHELINLFVDYSEARDPEEHGRFRKLIEGLGKAGHSHPE